MTFLRGFIFSGVDFAINPSHRRSILLSNIVSLTLFGLGLILFVAYYLWYGWGVVTAAIPTVSFLCLSTIALNRFNHATVSRIILCLIVPVAALAISIYAKQLYYEYQEELDYFTFRFVILASCVFPAVFFSFREKRLLIATSLLGLLLLMLHDPLHNVFGVPYRQGVLKESNYAFTNIVILITYAIMYGAVIFLKRISEKSEDKAQRLIAELHQINTELTGKNREIEEQNHEITAQTESLNVSQQKLQEAYMVIAEQKELLLRQNKSLSLELVEANNDLSSTNNELIKHNNELRQFSYTVSHNLRGPVASLSGLINLIDPGNLTDQNSEIVGYIRTSIQKLEAIIKDLTKIIDIRQDIFHIRQRIDIESEIEEIIVGLKREIDQNRILIRADVDACPVVYSIRPMVHSILYNLITNAIKYRAPERRCEIVVTAREEGGLFVIEVTDNGLGIDLKSYKQQLFRLYKRFHHHTEGRGLGLYLVKLQAEALGGSVEVESELNRFTRFTVCIAKPQNIEQQLLYASSYAKIFYDARINSTGVIWNGPVSSEQYRNVFSKCLEFIKVYNTPNYLADLTHQGYITRDDHLWMTQNVLPEAVRHGLKRIASVRGEAIQTPEPLKTIALAGLNHEMFITFGEATEWIRNENEKSSLTT